MKTAIKMFPGFRWIWKQRSKVAKIRVFRVDYFDFHVEKLKNYSELDVRVIACNFFLFFSNFFHSNLFIFEPKIEKMYMGMGVFSTQFMPLISILAP